jgi:uncharacterized protein (TIGR02145 family)
MKNLIGIVVLLMFTGSIHAQIVRNVNFTVHGTEIHITYDLLDTGDEAQANICLYYSLNKGIDWEGPISKNLSGDVGNDIAYGNAKKIIWKPLLSLPWFFSDYVMFKVASGTFTDTRDGKTYKWVRIGSQVWMAENLNYNAGSGSWCYDDKSSNCNEYGRLYDWETAKKVCPEGWHLPSKSEFETLLDNFEGEEDAYKELISSGSSGFFALFGGWRGSDGDCRSIGRRGSFWSSSPGGVDDAWYLYVYSSYERAGMYGYGREWGFSVRCLQDSSR